MRTVNHIGISGGKDSTALLLWAVHESGYDPESIDVTFCDTGNESPLTYEYIAMLSAKVHPIKTLHPERDFYELAIHKQIFPSAKRRFCTQHLKLEPMRDYVYALENDDCNVLLHSGVRANESYERGKLPERDIDSYSALPVYRPLLKWTIDDVWEIHERYGVPRNPLYAMGMKRVGCFPCIMSSKAELRVIAKKYPERVEWLAQKETDMRAALAHLPTMRSFFHPANVPRSQRTGMTIDKDGAPFPIADVRDIFRWAMTSRGGQQYNFDFDDEPVTCSHTSGACE